MDADKIISLLKVNPLHHRRLTVIVSRLGLASDIDMFVREYCAPYGWQTPYNDVDYQEFVDACEGYRDKGIDPMEMPGIFFLRFGIAIDVDPETAICDFAADVISHDRTLRDGGSLCFRPDESGKYVKFYYAFHGRVIDITRDPITQEVRNDPRNHVLDHGGIKSIIQFAQGCSPDQKVRVRL